MLLALASERHFGRAAEAVGVTQQTLSAAIKQLEERFGVLLVQRGSRFQGFTPEGEKALEWARRIVGDARAMQQDVRTLRRDLSGHLRIAAIPIVEPEALHTLGLVAPHREPPIPAVGAFVAEAREAAHRLDAGLAAGP